MQTDKPASSKRIVTLLYLVLFILVGLIVGVLLVERVEFPLFFSVTPTPNVAALVPEECFPKVHSFEIKKDGPDIIALSGDFPTEIRGNILVAEPLFAFQAHLCEMDIEYKWTLDGEEMKGETEWFIKIELKDVPIGDHDLAVIMTDRVTRLQRTGTFRFRKP